MKTASHLAALVLLAALAACGGKGEGGPGGTGGPGGPDGKGGPAPPAPVTLAEVVVKEAKVELRAFGTAEPKAAVAVRSQVGGVLVAVHFREGEDVAKGNPLFTVDPRPAKAAKRLAEANLARDKVQHENARREAERQKGLFEKKLVSEEQYESAAAAAESLAATLRADEAAIQAASLQVDYSRIESPIDGRTGDLLVDPGNLVKANDAPLVTINQIRPIRVAFALPQRDLPAVTRGLAGAGEDGLEVRASIPGDEGAAEVGRVALVDNAVDPATGTIKVWAEFDNAEGRLWPGQLVNVVLTLATQADAVTVPSRAVQTGQKGSYVFVVGADATAEQRPIVVDRAFGDDTVVAEGLRPGERVVTDGQLRLKPGSKVVDKSAAPAKP